MQRAEPAAMVRDASRSARRVEGSRLDVSDVNVARHRAEIDPRARIDAQDTPRRHRMGRAVGAGRVPGLLAEIFQADDVRIGRVAGHFGNDADAAPAERWIAAEIDLAALRERDASAL